MGIIEYSEAQFVDINRVLSKVEWTQVLRILRAIGKEVAEDLLTLQHSFGQITLPQTPEVKQFIESCLYYHHGLLLPPLAQAKAAFLANPSELAGIQVALKDVEQSIKLLEERFAEVLGKTTDNWGFSTSITPPAPGSLIPTRSPYQLCHLALLKSPRVGAIIRGADDLHAYPGACLDPAQMSRLRYGRPAMLYVALHNGSPLLGASDVIWPSKKKMWQTSCFFKNITRQLRDTRLRDIIPRADRAFAALRRHEDELRLQRPYNTKYQLRQAAITDMGVDPCFLGVPGGETGLAFLVPSWGPRQPCYLCQAMLGCQSARHWTPEEQRQNIEVFC